MANTAVIMSLSEQNAVEQFGEDEYISVQFPRQLGNNMPIAYGGCTRAVAVNAACKTVKDSFNLYSVLGIFLGPALTDRPLKCRVYRSRDTRTFSTRRVVVWQTLPDGKARTCLELMADFQTTEPAVALTYAVTPICKYKPPSETPTVKELRDQFVSQGKLSGSRSSVLGAVFSLMDEHFEQRPCVEGISGQNMLGWAKHLPTSQDHLPIVDKFSAEWIRAKGELSSPAEHLAALTFHMDGALSFLPLVHDHKFLEDMGQCSTLEFSLRIFSPNIDSAKWHVKEKKTIVAEGGRTLSEARLFDEAGALVAIESQQSIMRPLPTKPAL